MPDLAKFKQVSPFEEINGFTYSGAFPVNKGTVVALTGQGFQLGSTKINEMLGAVGAAFPNAVNQRYGVYPKVVIADSGHGNAILGILAYDGRENDENGLPLKFNPQKAAEMGVFISGQACPIITRGIVAYSGVAHAAPSAGSVAYISGAGTITTTNVGQKAVGKFLSAPDSRNIALLKLEL